MNRANDCGSFSFCHHPDMWCDQAHPVQLRHCLHAWVKGGMGPWGMWCRFQGTRAQPLLGHPAHKKISTQIAIGYTDGCTAGIFCVLDFSDKFRYVRCTEKSFENNVSHCHDLFDSTCPQWAGMQLRHTRLRGRLYCRTH